MNTLILMAKDIIGLMIPVMAAFFAYFGYIFGGGIGAGLAGGQAYLSAWSVMRYFRQQLPSNSGIPG